MEKMNARNKIGLKLLFWIAHTLMNMLTEEQRAELDSIMLSFSLDV